MLIFGTLVLPLDTDLRWRLLELLKPLIFVRAAHSWFKFHQPPHSKNFLSQDGSKSVLGWTESWTICCNSVEKMVIKTRLLLWEKIVWKCMKKNDCVVLLWNDCCYAMWKLMYWLWKTSLFVVVRKWLWWLWKKITVALWRLLWSCAKWVRHRVHL